MSMWGQGKWGLALRKGNCPWRQINNKLVNFMKYEKEIGILPSYLFPWMDWGMVVLLEVKYSKGKLVPHLNPWVRTASRGNTDKEINLNIGTWNVSTLWQVGKLENFPLEMIKWVNLSEVWWPGKGNILLGNYTSFYPGKIKTKKDFTIVIKIILLNMWLRWNVIAVDWYLWR